LRREFWVHEEANSPKKKKKEGRGYEIKLDQPKVTCTLNTLSCNPEQGRRGPGSPGSPDGPGGLGGHGGHGDPGGGRTAGQGCRRDWQV
jgi:hypothetical protein